MIRNTRRYLMAQYVRPLIAIRKPGSASPMLIGVPVWKVRIVDIDQPPMNASTTRFISFPIQRFRPTGTSTIVAITKRCVASFALIERSACRLSNSWGLPELRLVVINEFAPAEESSIAFEKV